MAAVTIGVRGYGRFNGVEEHAGRTVLLSAFTFSLMTFTSSESKSARSWRNSGNGSTSGLFQFISSERRLSLLLAARLDKVAEGQ